MSKAWCAGAAILILAHVAWHAAVQAGGYSGVLVSLLWLSPFVAGLVTSCFAPRRKIILGMSTAILSAVLVVAFNAAYQLLGHSVDFPGLSGGLILFSTTFVYAGAISAAGSVVGYLLTRKRKGKAG